MTVTTSETPAIRYSPEGLLYPFVGTWEAKARSVGDGGGGSNFARITPIAPQERIFRIDGIRLTWDTAVGAALTYVKLGRSSSSDITQDAETVLIVPTDGATTGQDHIDLPMGYHWRSNANDEVMIEWKAANANLQVLTVFAWGVFFEPLAGRSRIGAPRPILETSRNFGPNNL